MEFFIRQNSTYPLLKLRLVDDGVNDKSSFNDMLENSTITIDITDVETGFPIVLGGACQITTRTKKFDNTDDEYYIIYQFSLTGTSKKGRFEGKIKVDFLDEEQESIGVLNVPIKEKLYINIT